MNSQSVQNDKNFEMRRVWFAAAREATLTLVEGVVGAKLISPTVDFAVKSIQDRSVQEGALTVAMATAVFFLARATARGIWQTKNILYQKTELQP